MNTHGGYTMAHGRISPLALLVSAVLMTTAHPGIAATQRTEPVTGHAPVAAPVLSTLTPHVGDTITVTPNFSDIDGDTEDDTATGTSYQWQVEKTAGAGDYEDIAGQTGKTWTAAEAYAGKSVRVAVTPRTPTSTTDPHEGTPGYSQAAIVTAEIDEDNSAFAVTTKTANASITAGEQSGTDNEKATLELTLRTDTGLAVNGATVSFSVEPADPGVVVSAVTTNANGTYTAALTGTKAQTYTITPVVNNSPLSLTGTVTVLHAAVDAAASAVDIPIEATQQGTALAVNITARDKYSNYIPTSDLTDVQLAATAAAGVTTTTPSDNTTYTQITAIPKAYDADIRTNTATITVNGVELAANRKLAWSPDYYDTRCVPAQAYTNDLPSFTTKSFEATDGQWIAYKIGLLEKTESIGVDNTTGIQVRSGCRISGLSNKQWLSGFTISDKSSTAITYTSQLPVTGAEWSVTPPQMIEPTVIEMKQAYTSEADQYAEVDGYNVWIETPWSHPIYNATPRIDGTTYNTAEHGPAIATAGVCEFVAYDGTEPYGTTGTTYTITGYTSCSATRVLLPWTAKSGVYQSKDTVPDDGQAKQLYYTYDDNGAIAIMETRPITTGNTDIVALRSKTEAYSDSTVNIYITKERRLSYSGAHGAVKGMRPKSRP